MAPFFQLFMYVNMLYDIAWNTLCVYALLNDARIVISINILSMSV